MDGSINKFPPPDPAAWAGADPVAVGRRVRSRLPEGGLFADQHWRVAAAPLPLSRDLAKQIEGLGRVLLQFYRAANLLYRLSAEGREAPWVAEWLDRGKPRRIIELQRHPALKNELPRVIRPDVLLTDDGFVISELDSVPGGIGLTAWLNRTYGEIAESAAQPVAAAENAKRSGFPPKDGVMGGAGGMIEGFAGIFGDAPRIHVCVSEESATYRPEMEWLVRQLSDERFAVRDARFSDFKSGDAVYRFFELFDTAQVECSGRLFELAVENAIRLTPPPKAALEEKQLLALLWNRNLEGFWRRELGGSFFERMRRNVPVTWVMDPAPLPPHAAIPELGVTNWQQLKSMSQKERALILKASGFSESAWGARSVQLGSDLSAGDWAEAIDHALRSFSTTPFVLQRFHKPRLMRAEWHRPDENRVEAMDGRVRLCPYYFVHGEGDSARARLGGVLATICPADKKIIHGMKDAILAPCRADVGG